MNRLPTLFFPEVIIKKSAIFSPCRQYRYQLCRIWDSSKLYALFVGLNPSIADDKTDDHTVRRCINYSMAWGYGGMIIVNLFAYVSTDPTKLTTVPDPVGPENNKYLIEASAQAGTTVVAWGAGGALYGRDKIALKMLTRPMCLGITKDGFPKHPSRLRKDAKQIPFGWMEGKKALFKRGR